MQIRQASLEDVPKLHQLIERVNYKRDEHVGTGLIEYPVPTKERLAADIQNNPYALVAVADAVVGLHLGFTRERLLDKIPEDDFILGLQKRKDPFMYTDLLVVDPRYHRGGVGSTLQQLACAKAQQEGYTAGVALICTRPLNNVPSQKVFTRLGYRGWESFSVNGLVLRVYEAEF